MTAALKAPERYPRRILLAVTGLSPQIVTETIYALAVKNKPPFVPTEVHLLTTATGAKHARLTLLSKEPGWFYRLCQDYKLADIALTEDHLHVLQAPDGNPLEDIRTADENQWAADQLTAFIRDMTSDSNAALCVSIAGGRKTMGFYAGYALSLFGREQDRLTHVLVTPPFESNQQFFYPTPYSHVIFSPPPLSQPMDAKEALVDLADIPFVRLRHGIPENLLHGKALFSEVVQSINSNLAPPKLVIDYRQQKVFCAGVEVPLAPVDMAFLAWFARLAKNRHPGICRKTISLEETKIFLAEYQKLHDGVSTKVENLEKTLKNGMDTAYFDTRLSRLQQQLKTILGHRALPYLISNDRKRPRSHYRLTLLPEQIEWIA